MSKSQGRLLHLFCSAMTFTLCTKVPLVSSALGVASSSRISVAIKERQFLNPSFSHPLQLNCDKLRGILTECGTAQYYNGTPPSQWLGSSPILRQWLASQCKPVQHGQCWALAAVMCSGRVVVKDFCVEQRLIWSVELLAYAYICGLTQIPVISPLIFRKEADPVSLLINIQHH